MQLPEETEHGCKGKKEQYTVHIKVPYGGVYDTLRCRLNCSTVGAYLWSVLHLLLILEECLRGLVVVLLTLAFVFLFLVWKLVLLVLGVLLVVPGGVILYGTVALYRCRRSHEGWVEAMGELWIEYRVLLGDGVGEILGGRFATNCREEVVVWYRFVREVMLTEVLHDFAVIS